LEIVKNGVDNKTLFFITKILPDFIVINIRPSGIMVTPVGSRPVANLASVNPVGRVDATPVVLMARNKR
jgi:hypothetical protein